VTIPKLFAEVTIDPAWFAVALIAGIVIGYLIRVRDRNRSK